MTARIVIAIVAVAILFFAGVRYQMRSEEIRDVRDYRETIERLEDADRSRGDADADREWLRDRREP